MALAPALLEDYQGDTGFPHSYCFEICSFWVVAKLIFFKLGKIFKNKGIYWSFGLAHLPTEGFEPNKRRRIGVRYLESPWWLKSVSYAISNYLDALNNKSSSLTLTLCPLTLSLALALTPKLSKMRIEGALLFSASRYFHFFTFRLNCNSWNVKLERNDKIHVFLDFITEDREYVY